MHILPKEISQYPFYLRWAFRSQEKKLGQVLFPGLFWGRMPFLKILFSLFWGYLDRKKSILDPALRAIVQVRVAQLNWCAFCIDYNAMNLLKRTNSMEKFDFLSQWQTHSSFTDVERVALNYTEEMSKLEVKISDDLMKRLKKYFTDDQIVELTALIAFQNMSAKFNAALDIPSQGMCKISKTRGKSSGAL